MNLLLAVAAGLGAGAGAVLLSGALPAAVRRSRGIPVELPIVLAALGGLMSRAAPTGTLPIDLALNAGIGAMAAWAAARAPHRALAVGAILATALLHFSPWASAGAGVAMAVVLLRSRMPPLKAASGALLGVGLLTEIGPLGAGWREVLAAVGLVTLAGFSARRSSDGARRAYGIGLSAALAFVAIAAAGFLVFAVPAARDLERAVSLSEGATEVIATSRGEETSSSLALASRAFARAGERLGRWPARLVDAVPVAAQNAAALRALAGAGEHVAASAGAATTGPADLRVARGGIDLAAVDEAGRGVGRARVAVSEAISSLEATRSRSLLPPVADASDELHGRLADAAPALQLIERALDQLPELLGRSGTKRYLLSLQTPAESRASGGIIGAFAVLEATGGSLSLTRTGNAAELTRAGDPPAREVEGVEEFIERYGRFQPLQIWQNLTMTPDWPTVAKVAHQLFPQSGGEPLDGVIGLDPFALADILGATGPVDVPPWPVPVTADNATSVLLHEQYLYFPNPERREFVEDVTAAVFERLTGEGAPLRALVVSLADAARNRNIQLWSADPVTQALFRDVSVAGAFPAFHDDSDLLSVVNQNSSGNKIDWFLHRHTSYDLIFDPVLGRVDGRVRVELRNDAPTTGLPNYVIGGSVQSQIPTDPGENRTLLSVYTPLGLDGASLDGQPLEMEQADELGHRVYSAFFVIPPGATVVVELELSGLVDPEGSSYRLLTRGQVLPNQERMSVTVGFTEGWEADGRARADLEPRGEQQHVFGFRRSGD